MKPLIIFYSFCILTFYSALTFIGFRKEKFGDIKEGVLAEIVVTAPVCKTTETKLLAQHFDNVLAHLKQNHKAIAADQMYDALMVFTVRTISSGVHNEKEFWSIVKNLRDSYIDLSLNRPIATLKLEEVFESAELYVAEGFLLKSSEDNHRSSFLNAMSDISKAEEGIALAAKYSTINELELEKQLFNSSINLLKKIINERALRDASAGMKKMLNKLNNLEGSA